YDGGQLYNLHAFPQVHALVGAASVVSFFFLYPSTFNLLEVAAVEKPQLLLWETGVIRILRHPQMVGQLTWSAAHLLWLGTPFTAETMVLLCAHHAFAAWNEEKNHNHHHPPTHPPTTGWRLAAEHGEAFDVIKSRTSTVPFAAILDGRQVLPADYWAEWVRLPYAAIGVGCAGAYFAHPLMQGMAAYIENSGYSPGGLL
ncbi:hypothetical protein T492DRAFT_576016, partial [Pavlovales sp. CCMP2436]